MKEVFFIIGNIASGEQELCVLRACVCVRCVYVSMRVRIYYPKVFVCVRKNREQLREKQQFVTLSVGEKLKYQNNPGEKNRLITICGQKPIGSLLESTWDIAWTRLAGKSETIGGDVEGFFILK